MDLFLTTVLILLGSSLAKGETELVPDEATGVSPTMIYELLLSVLNVMTKDWPNETRQPISALQQPLCRSSVSEVEADEGMPSGRRLVATTVARNPYTGLLHPVIRPVYYPVATHYPRYPNLLYG